MKKIAAAILSGGNALTALAARKLLEAGYAPVVVVGPKKAYGVFGSTNFWDDGLMVSWRVPKLWGKSLQIDLEMINRGSDRGGFSGVASCYLINSPSKTILQAQVTW